MILSVQISLRMYSIYLIIIIIHNNYKLTSLYIYKRDIWRRNACIIDHYILIR